MSIRQMVGPPHYGLILFFLQGQRVVTAMERHSGHCKHGMWNVFYMPRSYRNDVCYDAVMDDYGNLVRIN